MNELLLRRRVAASKSLPYDAEIEYLQGDGYSYIDTGIVPLITDNVYAEFYLVTPFDSSDGSCSIYGVMSAWRRNAFAFALVQNKNSVFPLRGDRNPNNGITKVIISNFANSWQTQIMDNTTFQVFNVTTTVSGSETSCLASAYLFCIHVGESGFYGRGTSKRIRKFQHKRGGELIMDLIPVRVGQVGYMYDKVSKQLFGNAGTGSFILGPDKTN